MREMEPRRQGRIRAGRSRQLCRLPLPTGDRPRCVHPTQHHQDRCRPKAPCQRVVAEVLAVFTDRSSEFSSAACVDVYDRAGTGAFHGPHWSCLDNAVAESFFAALRSSSSNASITAPSPATKREPGIFRCGGRARNRSSAGALGSPVVAEL
jgi:hypothetical protein